LVTLAMRFSASWGGELQFIANDSNHYKFTGKERDSESGLDYFGARYYSNGLGRFITPDWAAKPAAVPYAVLGDPQSLNLYTYVRNIPTTLIDDDGHSVGTPDWSSKEAKVAMSAAVHADANTQATAALMVAGTVAALAAPELSPLARSLYGLFLGTAPVTMPIVGGAIEGLTPGPSGTLTISNGTRLTSAEISTGVRLAGQTGKALAESAHQGEEFVDAAGKTYDAMGGGKAFEHFGDGKSFFQSIVHHVNKSVDKVAIDLKGASKDQTKAIKDFVKTLNKDQKNKVIYVK
jgi:RHS repeat-associated protein